VLVRGVGCSATKRVPAQGMQPVEVFYITLPMDNPRRHGLKRPFEGKSAGIGMPLALEKRIEAIAD